MLLTHPVPVAAAAAFAAVAGLLPAHGSVPPPETLILAGSCVSLAPGFISQFFKSCRMN